MAASQQGKLKVTYGTGAFLWINAGAEPPQAPRQGIIRTIAWQLDKPAYAYEGFVMYAGTILDWLLSVLDLGRRCRCRGASREAGTSAGALLVPAFQGLASPWWQPDVRARSSWV